MSQIIDKKIALANSPLPSKEWKDLDENKKINLIKNVIDQTKLLDQFKVISSDLNGNTILRIENAIPANKRGILLLEIEKKLKEKIDNSIVLWLEPVGDKSKLRNLRGIEIKKEK
jgi:hypothetical protein